MKAIKIITGTVLILASTFALFDACFIDFTLGIYLSIFGMLQGAIIINTEPKPQ